MQRKIVHGVPYFADSLRRLYTWDAENKPQHIGEFASTHDQSVTFVPDHIAALTERLHAWRASQHPRPRKAQPTSRGNPDGEAAADENSDDHE
jgi:hypothetical protein